MIYWCCKCNEPIFDKELHKLSCEGRMILLSQGSVCNPVFKQEKKLISEIIKEDILDKKVWYFGSARYLIEGEEKIRSIPYIEWYKQKKYLLVSESLKNNIELEDDYSEYSGVVEANKNYLNNLILEAEQYIIDTCKKYCNERSNYIPTVSFSGGKDSTVVSRLVRDALQDNSIIHFFGDTTLEFKETYNYVNKAFREENPTVPVISSESNKDFFSLCKIFGPPSQFERWCCTIFKTSNLNKELEFLPGNSLSFLGIRHSESTARSNYERTKEASKISSQINAMPIIEWKDYDVWLYILYKKLAINDCYKYGYKRVGCWCCPNNSDWSMMLTEIYHPNDMQKWKDMIYDFAINTGKTDIDNYYEEGKWKVRMGASGLEEKNTTIIDTPCNLSEDARNIIIDKNIDKSIIEFLKPFGDLKVIEKSNGCIVEVYEYNKDNVYSKMFEVIITFGKNIIKVIPIEKQNVTTLIIRLKCQLRKYQYCIRCSACDSVCEYGAIDTIHGEYKIDEAKCVHCKKCIAKFYNGCIICDKVSGKKDK